ncbi:uncharacterized protein LOC128883610 isoform X2 [Hylaeus volcanicus]|uniref:uncharacterized protein LOC128883610 isoform X2 n=1 Tax=Hylaeus volcanicus TaxID=313075 RepID=UPI0023B7A293|nr:uncharacterized protein LOC128883610 isoform X2 [Hylaeus volcanicus]XP_053992129.1 uncharacterized protein LOC128883610 isoform X2 [Hylaeus volcanicus]XP_053992130.1 uncharacterized protein LOC128883610 isoform X2 [Hylaeus volcanicus]
MTEVDYCNSQPWYGTRLNENSSNFCGYITLDGEGENNFYVSRSSATTRGAGVLFFISAYATCMIGSLTLTYFFLLHYWYIPFALPFLILSQLFLQFILFFYSDYFCRLGFIVYAQMPGTDIVQTCFCSICDWILLLCYFVSWTAALVVIAPVFSTYRKLSVFPVSKNVLIASLNAKPHQQTSFIHFHPSVTFDFNIANGMLLNTERLEDSDINLFQKPYEMENRFVYSEKTDEFVLRFPYDANVWNSNTQLKIPFSLKKLLLKKFRKQLKLAPKNETLKYWKTSTFTPKNMENIQQIVNRKNFIHRLWPHISSGIFDDAIVACRLLQDRPKYFSFPSKSSANKKSINVWAVCSDAAIISCSCSGFKAPRLLKPYLCDNSHLCGMQIDKNMAHYGNIIQLIRSTKTLYNISQSSEDIFICLDNPEVMIFVYSCFFVCVDAPFNLLYSLGVSTIETCLI